MTTALSQSHTICCHECDLTVAVPHLQEGQKAVCPRCDYVIIRWHKNAVERIGIFSTTALLCFLVSLPFNFMTIGAQGQYRGLSLITMIEALFSLNATALGVLVLLIVLILPVVIAALMAYFSFAVQFGSIVTRRAVYLIRLIDRLRFWNMAEIYFLGIVISMIKVISLASISLGIGFWAYALFNLFLMLAFLHSDKYQLVLAVKQL